MNGEAKSALIAPARLGILLHCLDTSLNSTRADSANPRDNPFAHVAAAQRKTSVSTLIRIALLNLRHPWQVTVCLVSTVIAAGLMLWIPRLLGQAVDEARGVMTAGAAGEAALWPTAIVLLAGSIARGLFTLVQN